MKKLSVNKETALTNELIEINKKRIDEIDSDIKSIEERYKALMDAEKCALTSERENRIETIKALENILSLEKSAKTGKELPTAIDEAQPEAPKSEQEPSESEKAKDDEEPEIKDTLFPENNAPESEDENQDIVEEATETESETSAEETVSETEVIADDAPGFNFGDEQPESPVEEGDDWAQMPQEWQ